MAGILERLRQREVVTEKKKLFGVIAGPRLGGKTTLAGTLPGRTLLLQAAVLESGSESAKALAAKRGADLWVEEFSSVESLLKILAELKTDEDFDNVFVDGLSALSDFKFKDPKIVALTKQNGFDGFRALGEALNGVLLQIKELTYPDKTKKPKNAFVTCALAVKLDKAGSIADVSLECKGQMAVSTVTKLGEAVLTIMPPIRTEAGEGGHRMITKTQDWWPGRIDGILREANPGVIEPADLTEVLKLLGVK